MSDAKALTAYDWDVFADAALILADLDGCLISGETVLDGVADLFAQFGEKIAVVSNNSEDTSDTLAKRLAQLGLALLPTSGFLAGEQAVKQLATTHSDARVTLYASQAIVDLAAQLGIELVPASAKPDRVLLARDVTFTFADLTDLMGLAGEGTPVWLTNPDPSHPRADGGLVPETGALWAAVAAATNTTPERVIGKPEPLLLTEALTQFGVTAKNAVMIGDTAATDGAAAYAAGVRFFHVDQRRR